MEPPDDHNLFDDDDSTDEPPADQDLSDDSDSTFEPPADQNLDCVNSNPDQTLWKFQEIVSHEGPLRSTHPKYMGSSYNVQLLWTDGSMTYEPLRTVGKDDPVTCALYAHKHGLLHKPGWKRFKRIAVDYLNQARLTSSRKSKSKRYKHG